MAKSKNRRPATVSSTRRLGAVPANQRSAPSSGAQRRASRAQRHRSNRIGWIAIAVVVVAAAAFVVANLTNGGSGTNKPGATSSGTASGQDPALASLPNMVDPVTTIPASVFNAVGTDGLPNPFTVTKGQPSLTEKGLLRYVYQGGEFCPYCAVARWSMVASLARFGTFTDLKQTSSASGDGDIPTFSFLGASYTSKYIVFSPYEYLDRNQNPLQTVPADAAKLYAKYDGSLTTLAAAKPFNPGTQSGIPFMDIGNRYVSSGDPTYLDPTIQDLYGGGPGADAVASAMHDPNSAVGQAIDSKLLIVFSNYITGAICNSDGQAPSSVCATPGVKAAEAGIAKSKAVG